MYDRTTDTTTRDSQKTQRRDEPCATLAREEGDRLSLR